MTRQTFTRPSWNTKADRKVAYINARLFDAASGLDEVGALLTEGDRIADFGKELFKNGVPEGIETVDCKGHLLSPGLLDIQVHFREPGQEYKETIETGSKSAAAGGVTRVVCMPNTTPVIDNVAVLEFLNKRAKETGYVHIHAYGAVSVGQKGEALTEMALLKEAGAVGFTDDGKPVMNALLQRQAMAYCRELGVPMAQHAEDLNLSNGGCMNEGAVATKLGLAGIPNASEAIIVARDVLLAELTGGQYHVLHISTAEAVDQVRWAKRKGLKVTCEAAPHHFTLTDEAVENYRTFTKMNPPLRAEKDRLAILEGLKDGTIDAIATDHAPHDQESKRVPMAQASFGIVGLETMLPLSLTALYHSGFMNLADVMATMTYKPADIIHVEAGRIAKGAIADLTLIDLDHEWTITPDDFVSKSKNSPYGEYNAKGRAIRTVVGGETVYTLDV
ncbi:MAG: dihydroorotase [Alphaproteobacteria bacterium]|nr:dihydroorotase [Alphaproteobacteria bacterium]